MPSDDGDDGEAGGVGCGGGGGGGGGGRGGGSGGVGDGGGGGGSGGGGEAKPVSFAQVAAQEAPAGRSPFIHGYVNEAGLVGCAGSRGGATMERPKHTPSSVRGTVTIDHLLSTGAYGAYGALPAASAASPEQQGAVSSDASCRT